MKTNLRGIFRLASTIFLLGLGSLQGLASDAYDVLIHEVSNRHSIDPLLVKALISKESKFEPDAVGKHGEIGLMQLKQVVALDWAAAHGTQAPSREELFLPATNIEIGVWYLSQALSSWKGYRQSRVLALCQYNAGRSKMKEWLPSRKSGEVEIRQDSTRSYVSDILGVYSQYKQSARLNGINPPIISENDPAERSPST